MSQLKVTPFFPDGRLQGVSMSEANPEVVAEIYMAMEQLGRAATCLESSAHGGLAAEPHVLSMLRGWNAATERSECRETTSPHRVDSLA